MQLQELENIGLTRSEAKVYETLLQLGLSAIGLISKKSEVSTSKIYEVLDRLINKGLVSHTQKSNVKYFMASPPSMLKEYIKEKSDKIKEEERFVEEIIPKLSAIRKSSEYNSSVVYEGVKGLKAISNEILDSKEKEFRVISSTPYKNEYFNRFWIKWNKNGRIENSIHMKILFGSKRTDFSKEYEKMKLTEVKYLTAPNAAGFGVIDNKLVIFTYKEEPEFFLITNKETATSFKSFFTMLWKQGKKK